jgi:hypothetical protein
LSWGSHWPVCQATHVKEERREVKVLVKKVSEVTGLWWAHSGNMVFVRDGVIFGVGHGFCVFLDVVCVFRGL